MSASWAIDCLATLWSANVSACSRLFDECDQLSYALTLNVLTLSIQCLTPHHFEQSNVYRARNIIHHILLHLLGRYKEQPTSPSRELKDALCSVIIETSRAADHGHDDSLKYLEPLRSLIEGQTRSAERTTALSNDFDRIMWLVGSDETHQPEAVPAPEDFDNYELGRKAHQLFLKADPPPDDHRPPKRPRLETSGAKSALEPISQSWMLPLIELTGTTEQAANPNESSSKRLLAAFNRLPSERRYELLLMVGKSACLAATGSHQSCPVCDVSTSIRPLTRRLDAPLSEEMHDVVVELVKTSQELKSSPLRVAAMISLKRLFAHTGCAQHLDLRISPLGQWCLQSLKSSIRELRIAAVKTLAAFIHDASPVDLVRTNRLQYLDALRAMAEKPEASNQETCVLALGEAGVAISSEDELNIILLRLVEYLGHPNALISNLAFEELQRMTRNSPASALRLFEPYWRTIALLVVKDLNTRPQICQLLSDLLGISVADFLKRTQFHTIPYLILNRQGVALHRVVESHARNDVTLASICTEAAQLAAILACLLLQPSQDRRTNVLALLSEALPEFKDFNITDLLRAEPTGIAVELLKVAGDHGESSRARARQALQFLAENTPRRSVNSRSAGKKPNATGMFFEEGALGIMQQLSDVISQVNGSKPLSDRRRCVVAIHEMIILAKSHLCSALPQVRSCAIFSFRLSHALMGYLRSAHVSHLPCKSQLSEMRRSLAGSASSPPWMKKISRAS